MSQTRSTASPLVSALMLSGGGASLFAHEARLLGHAEPLPGEAARCVKCHGAAGAKRGAARPFAPAAPDPR